MVLAVGEMEWSRRENVVITVTLSFFHRKIGPIVLLAYPEQSLSENEKMRIADIMDQAFEEGFFTHSFSGDLGKTSMNYYFEIYSDWARGNKEMLMISIIFEQAVSSDLEHLVLSKTIGFAEKLKANKEIYKAFYINDLEAYDAAERELITQMNEKIRVWIKELYWAALEDTRKKTQEEKIANTLLSPEIYQTIKRLGVGPISLEDLKEWFTENFPDSDFEATLKKLETEKFIFINTIGVETYILLVRDVKVTRVPPECVMDIFTMDVGLQAIVDAYIERVASFFNDYEVLSEEEKERDGRTLVKFVANPRTYKVLSQLRSGPILKRELPGLVPERSLKSLYQTLEELQRQRIIEHFPWKGEEYVILIADVQFSIKFPNYLERLLPGRVAKPTVAESFRATSPIKPYATPSEPQKRIREKLAFFFQHLQNRGKTERQERKPKATAALTVIDDESREIFAIEDPFLEGWEKLAKMGAQDHQDEGEGVDDRERESPGGGEEGKGNAEGGDADDPTPPD
ncbi:MAG: hypothetical protein Kow0069_01780 [Promethearchaeota archaeon]